MRSNDLIYGPASRPPAIHTLKISSGQRSKNQNPWSAIQEQESVIHRVGSNSSPRINTPYPPGGVKRYFLFFRVLFNRLSARWPSVQLSGTDSRFLYGNRESRTIPHLGSCIWRDIVASIHDSRTRIVNRSHNPIIKAQMAIIYVNSAAVGANNDPSNSHLRNERR